MVGRAVAVAVAPKKKSGKAAVASRNATTLAAKVAVTGSYEGAVPTALAGLVHIPTALELAADPADIKVVRDLYGSRAQTILNALLSFDGYFNWYYPLKDQSRTFKVFDEDRTKVELRALDNCQTAIDLHEICERLSIRNHKSFLFHGAIYKVTRDILTVANPWMFGTSSLELQNADTKRVARLSGSKRLELSHIGQTRVGLNPGFEGPLRLTTTKGHGTTMALSTLNFLLVRGYLRRGDGLVATHPCLGGRSVCLG